MNDLLLINYGSSVKAMPSGKIIGTAVVYSGPGDPDRVNDFFSSATDYDLRDKASIALYWNHNQDRAIKGQLARARITSSANGLIAESKLNMRDPTQRRLWERAAAGELNFSTGSAAHIVERVPVTARVNWLKSWPIAEVSLCPRDEAAEPRAIVSVKSFIGMFEDEPPEVHQIYLEAKARELKLKFAESCGPDDINLQPLEVQRVYWQMKAIMVNMRHQETMAAIKGWR